MPGRFGQKILGALGDALGVEIAIEPQLPGKAVIRNDEHLLSAHPENGTYPRLAKLSDGSILSSYTHFEGPTRFLKVARSTDGGGRFTDWGLVTQGNGDVDNMYLHEVKPPGTVLAAFRNHDLGPHGPTWFRITLCQSRDGGRTWSYLTQVTEKGREPGFPLGIWEPFMRTGRQGEVQLTFSQEFAPDDQRTMMTRSFDQGHTWTPPVCIAGAEERLRDGMTGIAETHDNGREALVLVFETTRFGKFNLEAIISYDDGNSWHCRHIVYTPRQGRCAGSPQIASFADGSMAVTFMTDEDILVPAWPGRSETKVVFAGPPRNGRIQWSKSKLVSPDSSIWPGITALEGQRALATFDHGGPKCKSITWGPK